MSGTPASTAPSTKMPNSPRPHRHADMMLQQPTEPHRAESPPRQLLRSLWDFRSGIGGLFAAALIPGVLAGSVLFYDIYRSERARLEQAALQTARALSMALERELAGISGKLQILATLPALQSGDLRTFYQQAHEVLSREQLAQAIVVIDATGQQVLNTLRPFGSDLPRTGHPELTRNTFETRRPQLSDLYIGAAAKRPFLALEVPVVRDGAVVYALNMGFPAERLNRMLLEQNLPEGWIAAVLDSQGTVVARNLNPEGAVGQKATPDLIAAMRGSNEGTLASRTLEGAPSFLAFTRPGPSRWTVVVAMKRDVLYASLYVHLMLAGLTIAAFTLGGTLLAWIFSRRLRESLHALELAAQAATRGDMSVMAAPSGPREVARLAESFNAMQEARREADAQLRLAASVFSAASEAIVIADRECRIVEVNAAFTDMTGYDRDEAIGRDSRLLVSDRHGPEILEALLQTLAATGRWQGDLWQRRKDGALFAAHMTLSAVKDAGGEVTHYLALFSDVTLAQEQKEEIERLAYRDALTRLPNRRLLSDRMDRALSLATRRARLVAVCYLDLDGFKLINDTYGHKVGDELLLEVARRLEHAVRSHDTVARLGGDEFVLVLTELTSEDEVGRVLERARRALAESFSLSGQRIESVSASIGVAFFPADAVDADALLRHADQAMYKAKRAGKNRIER